MEDSESLREETLFNSLVLELEDLSITTNNLTKQANNPEKRKTKYKGNSEREVTVEMSFIAGSKPIPALNHDSNTSTIQQRRMYRELVYGCRKKKVMMLVLYTKLN